MNIRKLFWKRKLKTQGDTLEKLKELEKEQWFDSKEIKALQEQRLREILSHAYNHVPYYRELLKDMLYQNGEISLEKFTEIPFLDKTTLRKNFDLLGSDEKGSRKWFKDSSGGSTGQPVSFIKDHVTTEWAQAIKILDNKWSQLDIGEKQIRLWGSERDLLAGKETFKTSAGRFLRNEMWLNAFKMNNENMKQYVERINEYRPKLILAYTSSIFELASFIERQNLKVFSPVSIMTSAGTLYPHMRETIERVFKTKVYNRYGSREVGDIACECEKHEGLHISSRTHYVEIVKADGTSAEPGEVGEIVITSLVNFSMPLIRYKIGDLGVMSSTSCSCGRGLPMLAEVTGRVTDAFVKKDGSIVVPEYIIHMVGVSFYSDILRKFQVIQEEYDLVKVLFVPKENYDINQLDELEKKKKEITDKIQMVMGNSCKVAFEIVNDIPPTPSGKYRYIVSNVER